MEEHCNCDLMEDYLSPEQAGWRGKEKERDYLVISYTERHGNISNTVEMDRNINQGILVRLKTECKRCRFLASILEYKCPFFSLHTNGHCS